MFWLCQNIYCVYVASFFGSSFKTSVGRLEVFSITVLTLALRSRIHFSYFYGGF